MKYTITPRNQFIALKAIILVFLLLALLYKYGKYSNGDLEFYSIFFLIFLIPVLYLHIEYYYFNKGTTLDVDLLQNKLVYYSKSGEIKTIRFDELKEIVYYMAPSWHRTIKMKMAPWEHYHYAIILTKDGEKIIITSLMVPNVEKALSEIKGVPTEIKNRIMPIIAIH
jgi:hypothetical protein